MAILVTQSTACFLPTGSCVVVSGVGGQGNQNWLLGAPLSGAQHPLL